MIDTHSHIHDESYGLDPDEVLAAGKSDGVLGTICVGTDIENSKQAIKFAAARDNVWASIGVHPHDAKSFTAEMHGLAELATHDGVVAVGECGLDYYYGYSDADSQKAVLRAHLEIAKGANLPVIFHIRGKEPDSSDAYSDFWQVYDEFRLPGVVHSFSAHTAQLEQALERDLFVGVNGIATFAKEGPQLDAYRAIPLKKLVLETDAPLLTPVPYRGKINEPKYIATIHAFLSELRGETKQEMREQTSRNASNLFGIEVLEP